MKKLIALSLTLALALSLVVAAPPTKNQTPQKATMVQKGQKPGQGRGHWREELYAKLKLTATQKKKIEAIDLKFRTDMGKLRDAKGDREANMAKFKKLMDKHDKDVLALLDKKQKVVYQAALKERSKRFMGGPGGRMGGPGGPGGPGGRPPMGSVKKK